MFLIYEYVDKLVDTNDVIMLNVLTIQMALFGTI